MHSRRNKHVRDSDETWVHFLWKEVCPIEKLTDFISILIEFLGDNKRYKIVESTPRLAIKVIWAVNFHDLANAKLIEN